MASFSDTLTAKHGGVPTWGWFAIGVGALAIIMFLRNRNAAAAASTSTSADTTGSTDLGSAANADALTQGAFPMSFMGGDIYNNVLSQPSATATATAKPPAPGPAPANNPVITIPYKVQKGDTFASIGQKFGISAQHVFSSQSTTIQKKAGSATGKPTANDVLLIPYNTQLAAAGLTVNPPK